MDDLGKLIAKLRQEKGLTQDELAEIIFCSRTTISYIESDERRVSSQQIIPLSKALGHDFTQYFKHFHEYNVVEHYHLAYQLLNLLDLYKYDHVNALLQCETIENEFNYGIPYILKEYSKAIVETYNNKNFSKAENIILNLLEIPNRESIFKFKPLTFREDRYYSCIILLSAILVYQKCYKESQAILTTFINHLEENTFNSSITKSHISLHYRKLYIAALNNHADISFKLNNLNSALDFCDKAEKAIMDYELNYILELVLKLKIEILYKMRNIEEAQNVYSQFKMICLLKGNITYLNNINELITSDYSQITI